jgi:RNA polymerase sigma factor (sigma-70 family)
MTDLSELYGKYSADVYRFSLSLCGNAAEAQDIVSETFLRVWSARDDLRLSTVKAYLFAIARNLFLHERRRVRRQEELTEEWMDTAPGPAENAEDRRRLSVVLAALQEMPETDRSAVLMRSEGISYEEIAAALGLSIGATRVKVHRARLRLSRIRTK